ncbi:indolepyruvate ferredoxin oxidoreductase subunit alpha [Pyrococcus abyssi]|uniref:Indolepyruvate oxidoreductase subunit IorA n=1 Tax=Pyrococcus abyssi (strain GE5 / Orsay) TaxID=272844 RepID=IORA_PYRAB|nr:indolepyruvate ferredoxin oxidoreductase subunit alpha [Pyrococcus abyssi]Q9UZ57.1 RecName: Full=Indolepyruvate oxidoreductase subunit IorA; Short=IOR; AltName: Full=Indolepyruvate ferredoxin oxidoreductase subunit alpha [Pyrococcus abyssi GE5]CAB50202.1 iorA indolepyruvate ferredoxin oxidoreductase, subunit alpha [Pyrococcus abyssi GE5]CCE70737.1 TPA: indolepyruvate ferredoxin oxidoreductase, subunit alpha [Pyrococcus abyssi GE5]
MVKVTDIVLWDKPGERVLLLGNQAIVRGALEGNIGVYAAYPGTPSSEITDTMAAVASRAGVYMEYSTNEKVAFETALSASWAGLRAMTAMKHVGLNVAMDSFMTVSYMGVNGGLVVVVADDPSMWSSQNEQDTRAIAKFANIPVLEPSSVQEAKDMVKYAFEISEKYGQMVILRTTTRSSHMRGDVVLGELPQEIKEGKRKFGDFKKNPERYVDIPAFQRPKHKWLLETIEKFREEFNNSPFNWIEGPEDAKVGIIAPGLSYAYVKEALAWLGVDNVKVLKLGTPFPVPYGLLEKFFQGLERVLIVEELEPVVEEQVKVWAFDKGINVEIHGKDLVPRVYEMTTRRAVEAIAKFLGLETPINFEEIDEKYKKVQEIVPPRPPSLCPACPHRNTFFALRKAATPRAIYPSDIGCYTLGVLPPLKTVDTTIAMGGSIGVAHGLSIALNGSIAEEQRKTGKGKKIIAATIGDSTFFHTGLPALANAIYNRSNVLIVVLDNLVTAMTGDQPNPGTGETPHGPGKRILIEEVAKAMGADFVAVVDPYDIKETYETFKKALEVEGVSVVVARRACALYRIGQLRRAGKQWPIYQVNEDKCTGCKICINAYGCPAIYWDPEKKKAKVDPLMCWGCGGCAQVCPFDAFEKVREGEL